ncbi:hypothetical protein Ocin01_17500 [Orchesella cincta]|uniref:Uncharacterized protein n=1 Tax=Orchesella cincta TaxID=48709 RepID=A0A1D2M8C8_ORCCI|nr:hypothetical protein Ocin01_17500 [Orchesella cincta]
MGGVKSKIKAPATGDWRTGPNFKSSQVDSPAPMITWQENAEKQVFATGGLLLEWLGFLPPIKIQGPPPSSQPSAVNHPHWIDFRGMGFCLGGELAFGGDDDDDSSSITLSGRLATKDESSIFTGYLRTNSFGYTYYEKLNSGTSSIQTQLGLQIHMSTTSGELRAAVATRFHNPFSKCTYKLMFDTSGTLTSLMEMPLTSSPSIYQAAYV